MSGFFETTAEHPEPAEAEIVGSIPSWLNGIFLRNGPGIFEVGSDKYEHIFDGLAIMQKFKITNQKVWFSTKYLRSEAFKRNMAAQRIVVSEFGTVAFPDPCKSLFSRYFSYYMNPLEFTDNCLVNFAQLQDEVFVLTETPTMHRIDPNTLDALDRVDLRKYVTVNSATAHPHYLLDGSLLNMGTSMREYLLFKIPPNVPTNYDGATQGQVLNPQIVARIPASSFSYYHSFALAGNYVVFVEQPLVMSTLKLLWAATFHTRPFRECLEWHGDKQVILHVVDMRSGQPIKRRYTAGAFLTFHHANAYEDSNGCIVVDLCCFPNADVVLKAATLESIRKKCDASLEEGEKREQTSFRRFILPLEIAENSRVEEDLLQNRFPKFPAAKAVLQVDGSIHCTAETIVEGVPFEFPRINYDAVNGKPYSFCYGAQLSEEDNLVTTGAVKVNVEEKTVEKWMRENAKQLVGEPVFVARPNATSEDDGVVLATVMDITEGNRDFLLILDGKTFQELARAYVPHRSPAAFHGHYISTSS